MAIWSTHKSAGFLFPATGPFSYTAGTGGVIKGWDDGCLTMAVGETARLEIPWQFAYGAQGKQGLIKTLNFFRTPWLQDSWPI